MSKSLSRVLLSESGSMTSAGEERLIGVCDNGDAITPTGKYTGNGKCMINEDA